MTTQPVETQVELRARREALRRQLAELEAEESAAAARQGAEAACAAKRQAEPPKEAPKGKRGRPGKGWVVRHNGVGGFLTMGAGGKGWNWTDPEKRDNATVFRKREEARATIGELGFKRGDTTIEPAEGLPAELTRGAELDPDGPAAHRQGVNIEEHERRAAGKTPCGNEGTCADCDVYGCDDNPARQKADERPAFVEPGQVWRCEVEMFCVKGRPPAGSPAVGWEVEWADGHGTIELESSFERWDFMGYGSCEMGKKCDRFEPAADPRDPPHAEVCGDVLQDESGNVLGICCLELGHAAKNHESHDFETGKLGQLWTGKHDRDAEACGPFCHHDGPGDLACAAPVDHKGHHYASTPKGPVTWPAACEAPGCIKPPRHGGPHGDGFGKWGETAKASGEPAVCAACVQSYGPKLAKRCANCWLPEEEFCRDAGLSPSEGKALILIDRGQCSTRAVQNELGEQTGAALLALQGRDLIRSAANVPQLWQLTAGGRAILDGCTGIGCSGQALGSGEPSRTSENLNSSSAGVSASNGSASGSDSADPNVAQVCGSPLGSSGFLSEVRGGGEIRGTSQPAETERDSAHKETACAVDVPSAAKLPALPSGDSPANPLELNPLSPLPVRLELELAEPSSSEGIAAEYESIQGGAHALVMRLLAERDASGLRLSEHEGTIAALRFQLAHERQERRTIPAEPPPPIPVHEQSGADEWDAIAAGLRAATRMCFGATPEHNDGRAEVAAAIEATKEAAALVKLLRDNLPAIPLDIGSSQQARILDQVYLSTQALSLYLSGISAVLTAKPAGEV